MGRVKVPTDQTDHVDQQFDQTTLRADQAKPVNDEGAQTPKQPGDAQFASVVALAKRTADYITPALLDNIGEPHAKDLVVSGFTKQLIASMRSLADWVSHHANDVKVTDALEWMRKLDAQIEALWAVGRRKQIHMRESGLETIFDLEEEIGKPLGYTQAAQRRALTYYSEDFKSQETHVNGKDVKQIDGAEHGKVGASDVNSHAQLVGVVAGQMSIVSRAIRDAYAQMKDVINEADSAPEDHSILEMLATIASSLILAQIAGPVSAMIKSKLDAQMKRVVSTQPRYTVHDLGPNGEVPPPVDIEHDVSVRFSSSVHGAVSDAAKTAITKGPGTVIETVQGKDGAHADSKKVFLHQLQQRTSALETSVTARSAGLLESGELHRLPTDQLWNVYHALADAEFQRRIEASASASMIQEWVNFTREAAKQYGIDAGTGKHIKHGESSKLDTLKPTDAAGECRIVFKATGAYRNVLVPTHASVHGLSSAVLQQLQSQQGNCYTLKVTRNIEVADEFGNLAKFTVAPDDAFSLDPTTLDVNVKLLLAHLGTRSPGHVRKPADLDEKPHAHHEKNEKLQTPREMLSRKVGEVVPEAQRMADVREGMVVAFAALSQVPRSMIKGA